VLNGNATALSCNCYTLTPDQAHRQGSVWNSHEIDLSQSFDFHFKVFLGCRVQGSDGIAFVLQPVGTAIGSDGEGLGFSGIRPSLALTIDTHLNPNDDDPPFDHLAFQANGDVDHADTNNLAGPVQALAGSPTIKDCAWHLLEIKWDAPDTTLTAYIDGVFRLALTRDIVDSVFLGKSAVYWGFTGATGAGYNLQQFCTALDAHIAINDGVTCAGLPVVFRDSSISFGPIGGWYWDFGDGSGSTSAHPPPHTYAATGAYTVSEVIQSQDGCASDTARSIVVVGSHPHPGFVPGNACSGRPLPLVNTSTDTLGGFASWHWQLSDGRTFTDSLPVIVLGPAASVTLRLSTTSALGCAGDTLTVAFVTHPTPAVSFVGDSVCAGQPLRLRAENISAVSIDDWYWLLGATADSGQTVTPIYPTETGFVASLWARSIDGCYSDTVGQPIAVQASHAYAGQDTVIALGASLPLHAAGGQTYRWSPPDGLTDPAVATPVATIAQTTRYTVTAYTSLGCASESSILVGVYKGPAIYVPNAFTPNGDGINDVVTLTAPGIRSLTYFRIYDRWGHLVFSTTNPHATWDGTVSGAPVPAGAYVYSLRAIDTAGNALAQRGTILLIR